MTNDQKLQQDCLSLKISKKTIQIGKNTWDICIWANHSPLLLSLINYFNLKNLQYNYCQLFLELLYHYGVSTLCTSGVKKEQNAYLLQVQFHFEIDALNTVSAAFEITKIFFTLQVCDFGNETLNMFFSYHTLDLITI